MEYNLTDLKKKKVINVADGKDLGKITDMVITYPEGKIKGIIVPGKKSERTVFTMAKFTIPDGKCLVVELNEKNGGRHQSFVIENEDLVRANNINELQVR